MTHPSSRSAPSAAPRGGFTLIELMVSLVVLVIAVGAAMGSVSSFVALGAASREKALALAEAQRVVEQMQSTPFRSVLAAFNATDADDPPGLVSPGAAFDVEALTPRADDPDGFVGRIELPVDPATPALLREDRVDASFGFPRDLTADGVVDALDHSGDYQILPVRVLVEWTSSSGRRSVELETVLRNP